MISAHTQTEPHAGHGTRIANPDHRKLAEETCPVSLRRPPVIVVPVRKGHIYRAERGWLSRHFEQLAAPGWPQPGPIQDQKQRPEVIKPQVRTGAPPGTRTPNPRIKSPLLCSRVPRYYLLLRARTSEDMSMTCEESTREGRPLPACTGASEQARSKHQTI